MSKLKSIIKPWFKAYAKPTETQFYKFFDSIFFKDEKIPPNQIQGLGELLLKKADQDTFENHINNKTEHTSANEKIYWNSKLDRAPFNAHVLDKKAHLTPQQVINWDNKLDSDALVNYYLKTQIDDKIIASQNEVIAQLLDNPDADINSIKELNNLIQKNLTVIATKVSFSETQSLTTEQKQIAQKNLGIFDTFLKLSGGTVKGEVTFSEPVKFHHSTYFDVESEFGEEVLFEKGINILSQVILGENEEVSINSETHFIKSVLKKPSLFSGLIEMDIQAIKIETASSKTLINKEYLEEQLKLLGKQVKSYESSKEATSNLLNIHRPNAKVDEILVSPVKPEMYRKLADGRWVKYVGEII